MAKLQKYLSSDSSSDIHNEEVDEQPCLPVDTDATIHLPHYMSTADRIHVEDKFVRARHKEEKAKSIARLYRDHCIKLTTEVAQLQLEQAQLKADFTNEKNRIRHFWREQVMEGKSRSGKILQLALNN